MKYIIGILFIVLTWSAYMAVTSSDKPAPITQKYTVSSEEPRQELKEIIVIEEEYEF